MKNLRHAALRAVKTLAVSASILLVGYSASAGSGDAGCGLGSMVITKNSKLSQTLAITTNGTLSSQWFGITFGTSNCSASGFAFNEQETVKYAEANFQSIKVEMARGQGESLAAFAQLLGCQGDTVVTGFGEMTRTRFNEIYSSDSVGPAQMIHSVKSELSRQPALAAGCKVST